MLLEENSGPIQPSYFFPHHSNGPRTRCTFFIHLGLHLMVDLLFSLWSASHFSLFLEVAKKKQLRTEDLLTITGH